jgi:toxin ParE1/3/4
MTSLLYTSRARRDLARIVETIAIDNPAAAERFVARLNQHCSLLVKTPKIGRLRPEVGSGIRSLVQGNYLIFYRHLPDKEESRFCGCGMAEEGCLAFTALQIDQT